MRRWMVVAVLAGLVGCDDNSSSSKPAVLPSTPSAPAAQAAPNAVAPAPTAAAADAPAGDAAGPGITWTLPTGWTQRQGSSMRIATLTSDTAVEVSVTGFAGQAGGLIANINRWRQQLELPAIADADIPSATQKIPTASGEATLVDITRSAAEPQKLVAAIVPGSGKTFFFKMVGPAKRIDEAKAGFLALLKTVKADAAQ